MFFPIPTFASTIGTTSRLHVVNTKKKYSLLNLGEDKLVQMNLMCKINISHAMEISKIQLKHITSGGINL